MNIIIHYQIDDEEVKSVLRNDEYGGDDDWSWVALAPRGPSGARIVEVWACVSAVGSYVRIGVWQGAPPGHCILIVYSLSPPTSQGSRLYR